MFLFIIIHEEINEQCGEACWQGFEDGVRDFIGSHGFIVAKVF